MPTKDDVFKTHPMNFLNEKTLKGTFFGNYKPRTDLPNVVELYMKKVKIIAEQNQICNLNVHCSEIYGQ